MFLLKGRDRYVKFELNKLENDPEMMQAHIGLHKHRRIGLNCINQGPKYLFGKGHF